jgi:tRNA nucleotidyltransferase (CCA-adding enzyme)
VEANDLLRALSGLPSVYVAGGWLRDCYWGQESQDIDLAVAEPLQPVLEALRRLTGCEPFKLNERFQSWRVVADGLTVDVSPLHADGVLADIARRDYTVNTLMWPVSMNLPPKLDGGHGVLADPRTWDDLTQRVLRVTSAQSLEEDPLRILRGYRLAAEWGLSIDPETRAAWLELRGELQRSAPERIHEELLRWFAVPPVMTLRMAAEDGVLWELFPPLRDTVGCDQLGYHHLDVWEHTLLALEKLEEIRLDPPAELGESVAAELRAAWDAPVGNRAAAGTLMRLALLLHDTAKPATRAVKPDGVPSFHGHQEVAVQEVQPLLEGLRFSSDEVAFVVLLIREHMRLGYYSDPDKLSAKLAYRFIRHLGAAVPMAVLHNLADCAATGGPLAAGSWERHVTAAKFILGHYYSRSAVAQPPVLLDGNAIMELTGLPAGPRIGQLKEALLEATAAGEVTTEAEARAFVLAL